MFIVRFNLLAKSKFMHLIVTIYCVSTHSAMLHMTSFRCHYLVSCSILQDVIFFCCRIDVMEKLHVETMLILDIFALYYNVYLIMENPKYIFLLQIYLCIKPI